MKRSTQQLGIRKWYGQDLLDLQAEPFKVLDGLLGQYGSYIVSGCEVSANGTKYNIAPGLVVLSGLDPNGETVRMVVPYAGATSTTLPLYLTLGFETELRTYDDGITRPVAINYRAVATSVRPAGDSLVIASSGARRLVDALQDGQHQMISGSERAAWNAKESVADAQEKADKALNEANTYTDNAVETTKNDLLLIIDGKEYSLRAAIGASKYDIVGEAPSTLNSLGKIASALNNDSNFNTTIRSLIAARADSSLSNVSLTKLMTTNGYYKAPDGLMIQWGEIGQISSGQSARTIYFPTSFYYTAYAISLTSYTGDADVKGFSGASYTALSTSYMTVCPRYTSGEGSFATNIYKWLAIGRWK